MRFAVIGGDAAGMSAASRAKRKQPKMEVTVLEQTRDVSYSACGMPYNIADPDREMDDLVVRHPHVFRDKQGIDLRTGYRVERIDPTAKIISGRTAKGHGFQLPYDRLLIATGAAPIIPNMPGFDLPGVMPLKSLEDGRRIKRFIIERNVRRVVIIGMGYIALEMCESFRTRGIEVDAVKPRPGLLPWMNEKLSAMVKDEIQVNGVNLYMGHEVRHIDKSGLNLRAICSDRELEGQMILVAIGVKPNSRLAEDAGLQLGTNKAIAVNRTLLTSEK
ncbi:MAG: FAD-dependent oxidoreductase, partial [Thermodesulfobacteriota bacterium]|nr:FAD-dependent oxidoreductase [Thermodesulfobacteriota bacterium]